MKTLEMKQATGELASYAETVRRGPVVVTDHGKPVMALMPIANADLETVALSTDARFIALIERSRARQKPGHGTPLEEIKRKYGISTKPVRRRSRRPRKRRLGVETRRGQEPA
jgi:prevent-host-death family protein